MSSIKDEWIFYLKLSPNLSSNFLELDRNFKRYGYNLIPVSFPNLLELIKSNESFHVVVVVSSQREAAYYLKHVAKSLKNLLRFGKINLFAASSFSFINDTSQFARKENYEFYSLPIKSSELCENIITTLLDQVVENVEWPGGKRPRMAVGE